MKFVPAQFECAPIFEEVNLAVDHNIPFNGYYGACSPPSQTQVLFARETFVGINGSGKT